MPVTYLELENFKSYGGIQRIGPFRDFTCIIGPNGSGKSNLMDAISFVFGVQSRDLRSSQLKDLIYRPPGVTALTPSGSKKKGKNKNKLSARATLYYTSRSKKDNSKPKKKSNSKIIKSQNIEDDRSQDDDTADDDDSRSDNDEDTDEEDVMIFSRSISSSGVGEYSVNGKTVLYKEYEKELSNIGIIVSARNFLVFQGDVESLARKSPKELTALIENIATSSYSADNIEGDDGSDDDDNDDDNDDGNNDGNDESDTKKKRKLLSGRKLLQQEYQDAVAKKDETNSTTMFLYNQNKTYKSERKIYKEQKVEADKFFDLKQEHSKSKTNYYLWQLFHINENVRKSNAKINDELKVKIEEVQEKEKDLGDQLHDSKKELSVMRKQTIAIDKKRTKLQSQYDTKYKTDLLTYNESVKSTEKKIKQHDKQSEKANKQMDKQKEEIHKLDEEIDEYKETQKSLDEEYEQVKRETVSSQAGKNVSLTNEQEVELEKLRDKAASSSVSKRKQLSSFNRKLESLRSKVQTTTLETEEAKKSYKETKEVIVEFKSRNDTLSNSLVTTSSDIKATESKLVDVQKIITERNQKMEQIDHRLEDINKTLYEHKDFYRRNRDDQKLGNAIASLKRHFGNDNVHGRLVDLCKPSQKKYQLAVTVAAGKDMDAIVVSNQRVGFDCIRYLREQRIGTATFLPLDRLSVPTQENLERIRSMSTANMPFRLAIDCIIPNDDSMQKAILYAVGNTIICDDLDCARKVCFGDSNRQQRGRRPEQSRFKAVTLGGAVISKAGTMTGGSTRDDTNKANRWNESKIEKLREQKDQLENERNTLSSNSTGGTSMALGENENTNNINYNNLLEDSRANIRQLRTKEQYAQSDLRYTAKQLKEKQVLGKSLQKQVSKLEKELSTGTKEIDVLNQKIESTKLEIQTIENDILDAFRKKTGIEDINAYTEMITEKKSEYNAKKRKIMEYITQLEQKRQYESSRDYDKTLTNINKKIIDCKKELKKVESEKGKLIKKIDHIKNSLDVIEIDAKEATDNEKKQEEIVTNAQNEFNASHNDRLKIGKELSAEESMMERLRGKLHETLQKAQVDEVELPMIDEDSNTAKNSSSQRSQRSSQRSGRSSESNEEDKQLQDSQQENSMNRMTQYSQEENLKVMKDKSLSSRIDYIKLDIPLQEMVPETDREETKFKKEFENKISKLSIEIESMTPNMKASEAFQNITNKLKSSTEDYEKSKSDTRKANIEFQRIKKKRAKIFDDAFYHIDQSLKTIYTDMTKSSKHPLGGNAYLSLDDTDEPYNGGLKFNAMPPMKRFRDMEQLSGGEKTVAALSLLFAIHSYHPAPFFVMDEVDAALDNVNLRKVCNYISHRSQTDFQCIVISLKDMFYERSDSLVGICRDVGSNASATLTLDLVKFDKNKKNQSKETLIGASAENEKDGSKGRKRKIRASTSVIERETNDAAKKKLKGVARRDTRSRRGNSV